jgi:hypothetical protein
MTTKAMSEISNRFIGEYATLTRIDFVFDGEAFFQIPQVIPEISHRFVLLATVEAAPGDGEILVKFLLTQLFFPFPGVAANPQVILVAVAEGDLDQLAVNAVGAVDFVQGKFIGVQNVRE